MTKDGETVHNIVYTYDELHRLLTVYQGSNDRATHAYDANGNRISLKYATGTLTTYTYDKNNRLTQEKKTTGSTAATTVYEYDAFGNEEKPSTSDSNPFRYCGEYFDKETKTYYLRARYYDPTIGRFTQQDTHWSPANSIYGDNPRKINERQDALGLNTYAYAPEITAIMQSGNLYVYCVNNPVMYVDETGEYATSGQIHNWVVDDIVDEYKYIDMTTNFWIYYPPGNPYKKKYGIADLVSLKTGEVWEVKRVTLSVASAIKQLKRYYNHTPYYSEDYPNLVLVKGGTMGTYIQPGAVVKDTGDAVYFVFYWDIGGGIIQYNYIKYDRVAAVMAATVIIASYGCSAVQKDGAPLLPQKVCVTDRG